MEAIVASLRASHPVLATLTLANFQEHLSLVVPHLLLHDRELDGAILDNPMPEFATQAGAILFDRFEFKPRDTEFFFILCEYFKDQALLTRDPLIHQIVMFDTTMNSQAFRLEGIADCRVFELHRRLAVMQEKERCIQEHNLKVRVKERHAIHVDFATEAWQAALLSAGFNPNLPAFWMVGNAATLMAEGRSTQLFSRIDNLSVPHSQIYADMNSGHKVVLRGGGDLKMVRVSAELGAFENYGESAHVFTPLAVWTVELLARRDAELHYFGSMWDADKLGRRCITNPGAAIVGPWYVVRFTKPEVAL